jgi:predicted nucleotidyltransferase
MVAFAGKPNGTFNADANTGHGFAVLLASVGALRPYQAAEIPTGQVHAPGV